MMRKYIHWITAILIILTIWAFCSARREVTLNPPENPVGGDFGLNTATLPPIMEQIAWCESRNRQFDENGLVLRGRENPYDVGKYQINTWYHGRRAKELGINLYTEEGNEQFALLLYEEQGTKPWYWSRGCWS